MPKLKPGTIWPAHAKVELTEDQINKIAATDMTFDQVEEKYGEDIAIRVGIARDPDASEWTDKDWDRARPVVEINPEFVERHVAHQTAEKLRSEGCDVSTQVPLDFLPGFRADLIVREGDKTKVIEVKTRSSIAADRRISELAYIINSKPGWAFELILVGDPPSRDAPSQDNPPGRDNILKRIEQACKALDSGLPEAALMLALSACEAALRASMADEGRSSSNTSYALNQALNRRVISWDECINLADLRKRVDAIAHGFTHDDLTPETITHLIQTARHLTNQLVVERKSPAAKWLAPTRDALAALLHDSDTGLPDSRPTETSTRETLAILSEILDSRAPPPSVRPNMRRRRATSNGTATALTSK